MPVTILNKKQQPTHHNNNSNSIVGPKCTLAACCPLVSHGEYADATDRWMGARQLHYAHRYGRGQHIIIIHLLIKHIHFTEIIPGFTCDS